MRPENCAVPRTRRFSRLLGIALANAPTHESGYSCSALRKLATLKVFRCGPWRIGGHAAVAARDDKTQKEEAAGVLDQAMGKVRERLGYPSDLVAADSVAGDRSTP